MDGDDDTVYDEMIITNIPLDDKNPSYMVAKTILVPRRKDPEPKEKDNGRPDS